MFPTNRERHELRCSYPLPPPKRHRTFFREEIELRGAPEGPLTNNF